MVNENSVWSIANKYALMDTKCGQLLKTIVVNRNFVWSIA